MYLIYKHLLRAAVGPFAFGFFVITFLFMIDVLYKYVDLFVSKGVPFGVATKVLALSLGHTFALSVPMAVLIGVLMGIGQLAADHEITAMKASGIGLGSVLRPLLLGAAVVMVGLTAYNHFVFPESNHTLANLLHDINRKKPMLEVRERMFTEMSPSMTIYVQEKDDRTGRIEDVTIFERRQPGDPFPRLTIAEWGLVVPDHDQDAMLIELYDGEIHDVPDPENPQKYQVIRFARHDILLTDMERDLVESGRQARGDREMNLIDLWEAAAGERMKQAQVGGHVTALGNDLVSYHWQLLDPEARRPLIGTDRGERQGQNEAYRLTRLATTQQKVELAASQTRYQQKVQRSYAVREARYLVEFHKKFAIPVACVVFVLLGVPMAVSTSRSGKGISVSLALAVYLVYYLFLVGGEKFADRGKLDPALAMWAANGLLTAVGIPIFLKTVREGPWLRLPQLRRGRRRPAAGERRPAAHGSTAP
ncbi:MAG: LptF/LptG family permease [Candidatus Krumholzibacteriia bacterium]